MQKALCPDVFNIVSFYKNLTAAWALPQNIYQIQPETVGTMMGKPYFFCDQTGKMLERSKN